MNCYNKLIKYYYLLIIKHCISLCDICTKTHTRPSMLRRTASNSLLWCLWITRSNRAELIDAEIICRIYVNPEAAWKVKNLCTKIQSIWNDLWLYYISLWSCLAHWDEMGWVGLYPTQHLARWDSLDTWHLHSSPIS